MEQKTYLHSTALRRVSENSIKSTHKLSFQRKINFASRRRLVLYYFLEERLTENTKGHCHTIRFIILMLNILTDFERTFTRHA